MRVAIVHYHLRRGGVTRVIEHALRALPDTVRSVVLIGEPPPEGAGGWPCPVGVIHGLGYDSPRPTTSPAALAGALCDAARGALGGPPDLWHIHNHSLGKCAALTGAVDHLARAGQRLLLQIHDLPEDGRPGNYAHLADHVDTPLYPSAPHVHYACINRRDAGFLRRAGLPHDRSHPLPNAVWVEGADTPDTGSDGDLFLYPTRAIRRKNLGEFLFWAASAESGQRFAVTLAPQNPAARGFYDRWVQISQDLRLPVTFELGADSMRPFAEIVRTARTVVTTSVAEGFGLAFLEPWLVGRPLAGRNLPDVTGEFGEAGVRLPGLYQRLEIPLGRIDISALRARLKRALQAAYTAYRRSTPDGAADAALADMIRHGHIDFGRLDEDEQERVLRQPVRERPLCAAASPDDIADNARAIAHHYSLDRYGKRLHAVYEQTAASVIGPIQSLSASTLLDAFLDPARFNLLRT